MGINAPTLIPDPKRLRLECIASGPQFVTIIVKTIEPLATCPTCGQDSRRIHSRYERKVADRPWNSVAVCLRLRSPKFFCPNDECPRAIFTERLPSLVQRYARRTVRLNEALRMIGYIAGGEAGARLAQALGYSVSPDTLLERVRQAPLGEHPTPRILGVDDWAKRKGQSYGTILVDLERHCVMDLLPDREAETLSAWLRAHPGVEIISRDRGGAYADGARKGAPAAVQVADRFHLMGNMTEAVERFIKRKQRDLHQAAEAVAASSAVAAVIPVEVTSPTNQVTPTRGELSRERRLARYRDVRELYRQGATIRGIAARFSMHRRTVRLFINSDVFPERAKRKSTSRLEPFAPYLKQRWDEGCHNSAQLWRELRSRGYRGSESMLRHWIKRWRKQLPADLRRRRRNQAQSYPIPLSVPSPRRATWLLLGKTEELKEEERSFTGKLLEICPEAKRVQALAQEFNEIVRCRQAEQLDLWLAAARESKISEMNSFVIGVERDKQAVEAALRYEWSNGQTEGQIKDVQEGSCDKTQEET